MRAKLRMRMVYPIAFIIALVLNSGRALPQTSTHPKLTGTLAKIAECAALDKDAILLPQQAECSDQYDHNGVPPHDAANSVDCHKKDNRWLDGDAIKQIASQSHPSGRGIRIFGAAFCKDELDLSGVELPYSLVLIQSYFKHGIRGENFRTHGDFIVDDSLIFENLTLTGAHIDGSLLGQRVFIQEFNIADGEVHGSVILIDSVLHKSAQFDRIKLSGDLSVRNSALSFFVAQNATIGGVLDLTGSEARCAYHLKKSQVGAVVVVDAGFGTLVVPEKDDPSPVKFSWLRMDDRDTVKRWRINPRVNVEIGSAEPCVYSQFSYQAEFFLFDNQVRTTLCLKSFQWVELYDRWLVLNDDEAWHKKHRLPVSILALNGTVAAKNIIIGLWPPSTTRTTDDSRLAAFRKLEAINVESKAFIYDFGDTGRHFTTFIDGLSVERVNSAVITCDYQPQLPRQEAIGTGQATVINELGSEVRLPRVTEVKNWLGRNTANTTQPFVAFAKAFDNVGADSTDLKVERASADLGNEVRQKRDTLAAGWHRQKAADGLDRIYGFLWEEGPHALLDALRFIAKGLLGLIADYGYRPAKVGWSVVIVIILFWTIFHWWLRIIAFKPEKKDEARRLGFMFLFDRLIPGYQIRDDNYEISAFFKGATAADPFDNTVVFGNRHYVPATAVETRRAEICIDLLRAIGIILAVFLVAAINQLVAQ